jgi:ferrous iron transport protein A
MMEMGLVKGAELEVVRLAPSGDPVEILLKGYSLALRKREAVNITLVVD